MNMYVNACIADELEIANEIAKQQSMRDEAEAEEMMKAEIYWQNEFLGNQPWD